MANVGNTVTESNTVENMTLTANEVANVLGESYKSVAKTLNILATEGKIQVTEKLVNNRPLKGYIVSVSDLQNIKDKFLYNRHSESVNISKAQQMVANAIKTTEKQEISNINQEQENVKFYEVMKENAELTKEVEKLKTDIQNKVNENVRLDADLSVARSEIRLISDKSQTMESAYAQEKQRSEKLEKVIRNRNFVIIILGAILLVIVAVGLTLYFIKNFTTSLG